MRKKVQDGREEAEDGISSFSPKEKNLINPKSRAFERGKEVEEERSSGGDH